MNKINIFFFCAVGVLAGEQLSHATLSEVLESDLKSVDLPKELEKSVTIEGEKKDGTIVAPKTLESLKQEVEAERHKKELLALELKTEEDRIKALVNETKKDVANAEKKRVTELAKSLLTKTIDRAAQSLLKNEEQRAAILSLENDKMPIDYLQSSLVLAARKIAEKEAQETEDALS